MSDPDSAAAIVRRSDDWKWLLVLDMLRAGATLVRPAKMRDYYTDDGQHMGRLSLSAGRVKKLEAAGVLVRVGADRYGAGKLPAPDMLHSESSPAGDQLVIPGCEQHPTPGTKQAVATLPVIEDMTPAQYDAWRARMGYSHAKAAGALGISLIHSKRLSKGSRSDVAGPDGNARAVPIDRTIALACAALEAGLQAE